MPKKPPLLLWCKKCAAGYGSIGEIPAICPACLQFTSWTTTAPAMNVPEPDLKASSSDHDFLVSLHIDPED